MDGSHATARRLQGGENTGTTILMVVFGVLIFVMIWLLARANKRAEARARQLAEEQLAQERRAQIEERLKLSEHWRSILQTAITENKLVVTLSQSDLSGKEASNLGDGQSQDEQNSEDVEVGTPTNLSMPEAGNNGTQDQEPPASHPLAQDSTVLQGRPPPPTSNATISISVCSGENPSRRSISNVCAICLENYQAGSEIVVSANEECPHAFHRDCILDYLVNVNVDQGTGTGASPGEDVKSPCPCCRQDFLSASPTEDSPSLVEENATMSAHEVEREADT